MTVYILAGGDDRDYDDFGKRLADVVTHTKQDPKILSCFFSSDSDQWPNRALAWEAWTKTYFGSRTQHKVASIEHFVSEVRWADVIYLHGGETLRLIETLSHYESIEALFDGKIVIGSSAGTNYLSKTFYSPIRDLIDVGSGIVPVSTIVHYGANDDGQVSLSSEQWQGIVDRMKSKIGDEQLILIPEGSFVTFIK